MSTASAPGSLLLSGAGAGLRLRIALDRRATCRVEGVAQGVAIESKEALSKAEAADVGELLSRSPSSVVAQVLGLLKVDRGLRVVTEWKLPAGSGIGGGAALALAATAAVGRAVGQELGAEQTLRLAREAARRAGLVDEDGFHAALWGGLVLTQGAGEALVARPLEVDPGRIGEALLLVDAGEAGGGAPAPAGSPGGAAVTERLAETLAGGRYPDVVPLMDEEADASPSSPGTERVREIVRGAGGAVRPLPGGRLVAVWAPPGARGPGPGEAVREALQAAGLKPVAVRVDLRGLDLD